MGKLEEKSKKRSRKENIQKIVLNTIKGAGLLSVALLAPNAVGTLYKLGVIKKNTNYRVNRTIDSLIKGGLVRFEKTDRGTFVCLTPAGEHHLYKQYDKGLIVKPKRWDGKWRVIIYDLKENKKSLREKLRLTLIGFGFTKLQDSVWVYPYDCEDLIVLMKADFKIGREVLYMIVDKIEQDESLKEKFGLS
ncbi:MAG: CRISPR-associated endonuclease Cas2 [Candidatus Paceibacterota bacterium]|jgi:DNA-binding transcriptional regulator PaaX